MKKLEEIFMELVKIPSPSGYELEVGNYIKTFLEDLGICDEIYFDSVGESNDSNSGNLIAKIRNPNSDFHIAISSHIDTVQKVGDIVKPVFENGIFKSDGTTILGADDKGAVAPILSAISKLDKSEAPNITLFFVCREEAGVFGSSLIDEREFGNLDLVLSFDGGSPPGDYITKSKGYFSFDVKISGKSAHSGKPENGNNAILAVANSLSKLTHGVLSENTTVNYGKIEGGGVRNAVPEEVTVWGEVRSFDQSEVESELQNIKEVFEKECGKIGCRVEFVMNENFPAYQLNSGSDLIQKTIETIKSTGANSEGFVMHAISDINNLSAYGVPALGVSIGEQNAHTKDEWISLDTMEKTERIVLEILKIFL